MFKIGVVGAGLIGDSHKSAIEKHPECVMTAVCDLNEEKAKILAEGTNAKIYTDYKEMVLKEDIDIVILNLPHFLHKEATVFCLDNGKHVLCEKPMAMSVSECDAMINAANKSGKKLAIGHMQKYSTANILAKKFYDEKTYGKLCRITHVCNAMYFKDTRPKWFLDKKTAGGGILINYGAHGLDKIYSITGLAVSEVYAVGNNFLTDDNIEAGAQVLLKLDGGESAVMTFSGEQGGIINETLYYYTNGIVKVVDDGDLFISVDDQPFEQISLEYTHMIGDQLFDFIRYIKGEENTMATGEYGREVIKVLEKAFKMIEKGGNINV